MRKRKEVVTDYPRNVHESNFGITKQINVNFRRYALYVLEHRGIPSFYDALTAVQRFVLMNAPKSFNKTLSVMGLCIHDKYEHGDKSLNGCINKVARPFGCSEQLLLGDGFFGSPVCREAAASRYTSVKINPFISEILKQHSVLNKKDENYQWEWLRTEIPIGLFTHVIGIAVGYASSILPRKPEEIVKFLDKKPANLNPHFINFNGTISPLEGSKKTWIIEGVQEFDDVHKTVNIKEIPPLMKYESFIKKLSKYYSSDGIDFEIKNDSTKNINITLRYKNGTSWDDFKQRICKMNKIMVSENLIFIKDTTVVEYDEIADYLNEFRAHRENVRRLQAIYDEKMYTEELEFLKGKLEYLKFMLAKKRTDSEIDSFMDKFTTGTKSKLNAIYLRELTPEGVKRAEESIRQMELTLAQEKIKIIELTTSWEKLVETLPTKSKSTGNKTVEEFGDEEIEIFDINEAFEEENIEVSTEEEE